MTIERRNTKNYKVICCDIVLESTIRAFSEEDARLKFIVTAGSKLNSKKSNVKRMLIIKEAGKEE